MKKTQIIDHLRNIRKQFVSWLSIIVIAMLAEEGYDEAYGARPLRRVIQRKLEDTLSESLLKGEIHMGDHVTAHVSTGHEILLTTSEPAYLPAGEGVLIE